jgi:hypothetical protein
VPLKSTGHHNCGTGPEEVEEEPMAMVSAKEQQQRAIFFTLL